MRAEDYRIPYRIVLGIIFGNLVNKIPNRYCFGINLVIFLCAMKKVFPALKTQVPQQSKKRFGVYQRACFHREKKENTYTPKSLQGVCGGPLRAALVYGFWPPKEAKKKRKGKREEPPSRPTPSV